MQIQAASQGAIKQNASPWMSNLRLGDEVASRGQIFTQDQKARTVSTC